MEHLVNNSLVEDPIKSQYCRRPTYGFGVTQRRILPFSDVWSAFDFSPLYYYYYGTSLIPTLINYIQYRFVFYIYLKKNR